MALIKCRECGHGVSTRAKTCPNCGAAPRRTYSLFTGLLAIGLAVWIVSKCVGSPGDASEKVSQAAVTSTGEPRELGIVQPRTESRTSLRAECSTTSSPDQFMVDTSRVTIDNGTTHDVVLTACPANGLPVYCDKDWSRGEILNRIRTPLSGDALVADPTGCWVAAGSNIKFKYFDVETASVHEFSFPVTALRKALYEWRTQGLKVQEHEAIAAPKPTPHPRPAEWDSGIGAMTEAEFDGQFNCPETYATEDDRKLALARMVAWYGSHHASVTVAGLVAYRMDLLKRHDCLETLANIKASRKAGAASSPYGLQAP